MLVEDEFLIAHAVRKMLESSGIVVIGPYPAVRPALDWLDNEPRPDGAILDVNLAEQRVFSLADRLLELGVRIVFTTGYDASSLPARYAGVTCLQKPVRIARVLEALGLGSSMSP
ncbi:response regulator [Luteibacter sp. PPL552]